ncbi:MAG: DnaD domain protein [Streptococcus sp.]|uniref:DnaD domain-containing protein n=1 Tax=Streptococcus sp. TaxID=1306 RepID=UPI002913A3CA|nr:DnaD domain protein [Streptococcus sp.]MDU4812474.1 DnaD domain protein [Streptococcus sp.]
MGNRRMISKTVTQTHRFLRLPLEAQALYFHLIQNCDDDGVVEAFPILRMIGASEDNLGLLVVKRFVKPLNEEMVYFVVDFHEQNTVRKDRYTPSVYKDLLEQNAENLITDSDDTTGKPLVNQTETTGKPNISKDNISKGKVSKGSSKETQEEKTTTTTAPIFSQEFINLYQSFEQESGRPLSAIQQQELGYMLDDFNADLIYEALKEAVNQGKVNFAYIKAILTRWKQDNLLTVDLVRNSKANRNKKAEEDTITSSLPPLPF